MQVTPAKPTLLTAVDLARRYNISQATVWRWRADGTLPTPVRLGPKMVRWDYQAIARWEQGRGFDGASNA